MKYIVTSYDNPDLDGTSGMYAYAEYLKKTGKESDYYIEGNPMQEVDIVCDIFNISLKGAKKIEKNDKIIVVDANSLVGIPAANPQNIVEFVDHHIKYDDNKVCMNATFQIEMVGAAATLIAEKFQKNNVKISREAAILLYYGIVSNTINFKGKVTTAKDLAMAKWLKEQCEEISDEKVAEIFIKKSKIRDSLKAEMEVQIVWEFSGKKITIAQLEYANVEKFLLDNEIKIKQILTEVKQENSLDYIFINCVDTLNGYSIILVIDRQTEEFVANLLNVEFINGKAKLDELILRKEIFRMLDAKI